MPKSYDQYIVGTSKLVEKLKSLPAEITKPVKGAVAAGAVLVQEEAVESIRASWTQGKDHVPSRPGEPPNADTGQLHESIMVEILDDGFSSATGTNVEHGKHLEFGTTNVEARPWLLPALKKNQKNITRLIGDKVAEALRNGRQR